MLRRSGVTIIILALFLFAAGLLPVLAAPPAAEPGQTVLVIPVKGEINEGLAIFLSRGLAKAKEQKAAAILLEIDTFGGLVNAATKIRDDLADSEVPTIAYVRNRAWSAGALIAIANRRIAFSPSGSMGAAQPIPATEKTISALKAEFAATASSTGRNPRIAEAMVDANLGFPGLANPGQLLTLTAAQAKQWGYADVIAETREQVLAYYGYGTVTVTEYSPTWSEKLARLLATPAAKVILLAVIFLAVLVEIKTAGLGIAALIGLLAAALLFGSRIISGLAGWEALLFFVAGIILILLETYIPGTFFAVLAGTASIFYSFYLALGADARAAYLLMAALVVAIVGFLVIVRRLPTSRLWHKLILKNAETSEQGFVSGGNYEQYLGREGVAVTLLRPAGIAEFDGVKLDVVAEGAYVSPGTKVKVIYVEGNRIVVRPTG